MAAEGRYRGTEHVSLLLILVILSILRTGRRTSASRRLIYLLTKERRTARRTRRTIKDRVTRWKDRVTAMTTMGLALALFH